MLHGKNGIKTQTNIENGSQVEGMNQTVKTITCKHKADTDYRRHLFLH